MTFYSDERTRGTAIIWKQGVQVSEVHSLVQSRLQSVEVGALTLFNVYAPSGQNNRTQRRDFFGHFGHDLFMATRGLCHGNLPVIGGEFKLKINVSESNPDGNVISDQNRIEQEILGFLNPLFNGFHRPGPIGGKPVNAGSTFIQDTSHLDNFLDGLGRLSPESRDSLEEPVELEGLLEVIKDCEKNKSPGIDGLPYEFYQVTGLPYDSLKIWFIE